jgi:dynactin 1
VVAASPQLRYTDSYQPTTRPIAGHQRTLSSGVSRLNATRSLASSRSASPPRASLPGTAPSSPAVRPRLASPAKHSPSVTLQTRNLVRRGSTSIDGPSSPTTPKPRSQPQAPLPAPQLHSAPSLVTHPIQSSSLRHGTTPPPETRVASPEMVQSIVQPLHAVGTNKTPHYITNFFD